MSYKPQPTSLVLYRWTNPETTCDYPYLALAPDQSVLLALGSYGLSFEWTVSAESASWLATDYEAMDETLSCDFATMRYVLDNVFSGGTEFGLVRFNRRLQPSRLQLSIYAQSEAEDGPEYLIKGIGNYQRLFRDTEELASVSVAEHAMLDVCISTLIEISDNLGTKLTAPPPPRYRASIPDRTRL